MTHDVFEEHRYQEARLHIIRDEPHRCHEHAAAESRRLLDEQRRCDSAAHTLPVNEYLARRCNSTKRWQHGLEQIRDPPNETMPVGDVAEEPVRETVSWKIWNDDDGLQPDREDGREGKLALRVIQPPVKQHHDGRRPLPVRSNLRSEVNNFEL